MISLTASTARAGLSALGLLTCGALLVGCGSGSDSEATDTGGSPSTSETTPATSGTSSTSDASSSGTPGADLPDCSSVWVAKATLPEKYAGCLDGMTTVPAAGRTCSFGGQLVTYDDRFYAVTGHVVNELPHLSTSRQYRTALTECQA